MTVFASVKTSIGNLGLVESEGAIVQLLWDCEDRPPETPLLHEASKQLLSYFVGERVEFDLPLKAQGSDFQRRVYDAMLSIPYGETVTYGDIASDLATSAQPVGNACGSNPIPIIIPCHRVLASSGLGGYSGSGGIEMKITLLRMENAIPYLI